MGRRRKIRRQLSLTAEVNEYLDMFAPTYDASSTADEAIRDSKGFKNWKKRKEKEDENN